MRSRIYASVVVLGLLCLLGDRSAEASAIVLSGVLDASQVVDGGGSSSTALGFGMVTIDTVLFTITTDLSWNGLTGIADRSHLHDAPEGESRMTPPNDQFFHEVLADSARTIPCNWAGAVFTDCVPATGTSHDVLQLTGPSDGYGFPDFASLVHAFVANGVYIDMHTELYPSGEIRGQLRTVPEPSSLLLAGIGIAGAATRRWKRGRTPHQLGKSAS